MYGLQDLIRSMNWSFLKAALMRSSAALICLTVHETCHGLAALALGDPTAKSRHRLSLNPFRHIDWFGLAMMLTVGFGWAKPVPVDPRYFKKPKLGMALTALAGPASNFVLAFLSILLSSAVYPYVTSPTSAVCGLYFWLRLYVSSLSIGLGLFNLLPIPPLDGAKVLGAFLPDRAYFGLMRYERYGILVLLALSWFGVTGDLISGAVLRIWEFFLELA